MVHPSQNPEPLLKFKEKKGNCPLESRPRQYDPSCKPAESHRRAQPHCEGRHTDRCQAKFSEHKTRQIRQQLFLGEEALITSGFLKANSQATVQRSNSYKRPPTPQPPRQRLVPCAGLRQVSRVRPPSRQVPSWALDAVDEDR